MEFSVEMIETCSLRRLLQDYVLSMYEYFVAVTFKTDFSLDAWHLRRTHYR
jgi:hypothetical protein